MVHSRLSSACRPRARPLLLAVALLGIVGLAGCSSSMQTTKVEGVDTAAVPIITVDENIDLTDVQDGGATLAQRLLDDDAFDLSPMVDTLRNNIFNEYAEQMPMTILPERQVIRTERYRNFNLLDRESSDERMQNLQNILVPDGYKKYDVAEGSVFGSRQQEMFGAVSDRTDALLFVSARYEMVEDNPFWHFFVPFTPDRAYVEATVDLEMVNRQGEVIMDISKTGRSEESMAMVAGLNLEADKIQSLCFTATARALSLVDTFTENQLQSAG